MNDTKHTQGEAQRRRAYYCMTGRNNDAAALHVAAIAKVAGSTT
jgi:hypothetical protein